MSSSDTIFSSSFRHMGWWRGGQCAAAAAAAVPPPFTDSIIWLPLNPSSLLFLLPQGCGQSDWTIFANVLPEFKYLIVCFNQISLQISTWATTSLYKITQERFFVTFSRVAFKCCRESPTFGYRRCIQRQRLKIGNNIITVINIRIFKWKQFNYLFIVLVSYWFLCADWMPFQCSLIAVLLSKNKQS